jgi:predicted Fe-Mo cluster-binding NifX family protein
MEAHMKIAFPTQEDRGMDSPVFGHFGSAACFIIVDDAGGNVEAVVNSNKQHEHGKCQPMVALNGRPVDAVVVGGIGMGALRKLNASGIKVFRAVEGSVADNLKLILTGKLPEFAMNMTCAGHGAGGGCAH